MAKSGTLKKKKKNTPSKKEARLAPSSTSFWSRFRLAGLILFFAGFILYVYSVGFDYVLDDKMVVSENNFTKKGFAGIKEILTTDSFQGFFGEQKNLIVGGRYRPLSIVTFAIEHQLFGLSTKVSHFVNVLLYGLTGLILFRVLVLLFPIKKKEHWWRSLAFVSSLLFILHPLHTEVVANIKGRDEILCLLLSLGTLYFSFRYVQKEKTTDLVLSGIIFFLALLAKENALPFLAVIPFAIYYFTKVDIKKNLTTLSPLVFASVAYLIVRYKVMGYFLSSGNEITNLMNNPFSGMDLGERLATAFYTLGAYLKLLVFPHPLTHDYYPYQVPISSWSDLPVIISLLLYLGMAAFAIWTIKRKHIVGFAILFYGATLSIVSNIPFTVGTFMNERFVYIPSVGFCIALAWLICRKLPEITEEKKGEFNLLSAGLLGIFVIGFAAKTFMRVPDWQNRFTLNEAAIKVSTNSARANCFMGVALYEEQLIKETDPTRRQQLIADITYYIDRSLSIYPDYSSAMTIKAGVLAEVYKNDRNLDKLLNGFFEIIQRKRSMPFINEYLTYLNNQGNNNAKLSVFYLKTGRYMQQQLKDRKHAAHYFNYGLQVDPNNNQLKIELASVQ